MARTLAALVAFVLLLAACSHAPPRLVQISSQVNRTWDPVTKSWSSRLSVFVQASSADGTKVFDRLHLIHDAQNLYFSLAKDQWAVVEKPGEFWVGANDLAFPDGQVPTGTWRALLVTRSGQKLEAPFEVPPVPVTAPAARSTPVAVRADPKTPGHYTVTGWPDDYLVWSRDPKGTVIARTKTVGSSFLVTAGARSFQLYSYDRNRGEGLVAGPFLVQDNAKPADS